MEKTRTIKATIGIYNDKNKSKINKKDYNAFREHLQCIQQLYYFTNGIYVAFQVQKTYCVYHKDWGCPDKGEPCILISAIANPKFIKNIDEWQDTALKIIDQLKYMYKQSTVTIEIYDSNIIYLAD